MLTDREENEKYVMYDMGTVGLDLDYINSLYEEYKQYPGTIDTNFIRAERYESLGGRGILIYSTYHKTRKELKEDLNRKMKEYEEDEYQRELEYNRIQEKIKNMYRGIKTKRTFNKVEEELRQKVEEVITKLRENLN